MFRSAQIGVLFIGVVLTACAPKPPTAPAAAPLAPARAPQPIVPPELNEAELRPYAVAGRGVLTGQAFVRQPNGQVVTCAAQTVYMVPNTTGIREYLTQSGGRTTERLIALVNDPRYASYSRRANCDAQGRFRFDGLAEGGWFAISVIRWRFGTVQNIATTTRPITITRAPQDVPLTFDMDNMGLPPR